MQTTPDCWYIEVDGSSQGPFPFATVRQAAREGKLGPATLVWCPGMSDWIAAGRVEGLFLPPALPYSDPPTLQIRMLDLDGGLAIGPDDPFSRAIAPQRPGAWRRFVARWIDLWLSVLPTALLAGLAFGLLSAEFGIWIQNNEALFGILIMPIAFLIDACVVRIFGNSLGKSVLGLRVCNTLGEPLRFQDYLKRNFSIWWYGCGACIPPLSVFMMVYQARSILHNGGTAYDIGRFRVDGEKLSRLRVAVAGLLVVTILAGSIILSIAGTTRAG